MPESTPLQALAEPDFRRYWLGQLVSLTGAWMQQVAAGWVIVGLTGSTATIATIAGVAAIPQVGLVLHGGVFADRYDRRRLLLVTQLALAGLAFIWAGLIASGQLRLLHVYALSLGVGAVLAFDLPAQQAMVPQLVPPESLSGAIALNQAIFHGSRLLGPALAGALIARTTTAMAFVANGVSYFAVIASLLVIRPRPIASRPSAGHGAALLEGLRYVRGRSDLLALIGLTALTAGFVFPFLVVFMPIAVKRLFHGDETGLGILMSSSGLGAMLGSIALLQVKPAWRGRVMSAAAVAMGVALAALSLARSVAPAAVLLSLLSFSISLSLGLSSTMLQVHIPDALRGRVLSLHGLCFAALMPLFAIVLGLLGEVLDLRLLIRLAAAGFLALTLPLLVRAGLLRAGAAQA